MGYENDEETNTKQSAKKTIQNRASNNNSKHTKNMRYLRIPPPQTMLTIISVPTYINEKPHTSFENTLTKQRPHL